MTTDPQPVQDQFGNNEGSRRIAAVKGACARAGGFPKDTTHGYAGDNEQAWIWGWYYCDASLRDPDFHPPQPVRETAPVPSDLENLYAAAKINHEHLGKRSCYPAGYVVALIERIAQVEQRAAKAEAQNREWIKQNGPGGWIDDLRQQVARLSAPVRGEEIENASKDDWATKWLSVGAFNRIMHNRVSASRKEEPNAS